MQNHTLKTGISKQFSELILERKGKTTEEIDFLIAADFNRKETLIQNKAAIMEVSGMKTIKGQGPNNNKNQYEHAPVHTESFICQCLCSF